MGQSDLGLGQKQYYFDGSKIAIAYKQLIHDLATALSNETSTVEQDVTDLFDFEKEIAQVRHQSFSAGLHAWRDLVLLDQCRTTRPAK